MTIINCILNLLLVLVIVKNTEADVYSDLNMHMRRMYAEARDALFQSITYLIEFNDRLHLYQNNTLVYRSPPISENSLYEVLKEISHLSMGLSAIFYNKCGQKMEERTVGNLKKILNYIDDPVKIQNRNLSAELTFAHLKYFEFVASFVDSLVETSEPVYDCEKYELFRNQIFPITDRNTYAAAKSLLYSLKREIDHIKRNFKNIDWSTIYAVTCGVHMPREDNPSSLFYQKLVKENFEGHYHIYSEDPSESGCKALIATHLIDLGIGEMYLKEAMAMHRDVFDDYTKEILKDINFDD